MTILNININDFGGINHHMEEFKNKYGKRWYISKWDELDKTKEVEGIFYCVEKYMPDIVIMEEYDINSTEAINFEVKMKNKGYILKSEKPEYKRPSMTVFYIKNDINYSYLSTGHTKNGRAYAIRVNDTIIYGTHVPPKYDEQFWNELYLFLKKHSKEEYILIGDFNTINNRNMEEFRKILYNAYDIWYQKGNREPLSCMGDYAIASNSILEDKIDISSFDEKYTDHPGIIVTLLKSNIKCIAPITGPMPLHFPAAASGHQYSSRRISCGCCVRRIR